MISQRQPKLFDLVAVTSSSPDSEVSDGDVGAVVELLPPDGLARASRSLTVLS